MIFKNLALVTLLFLFGCLSIADDKKPESTFKFAPAPFYSPNTGAGIDLVFLKFFPRPDEEDDTGKTSFITGYISGTQYKQFWLSFEPTYYWDNEKNEISGVLSFKIWPDKFFGIGNSTSENSEPYSIQTGLLHVQYYRNFYSKWSAGPLFEFRDDVVTYVEPNGMLSRNTIPGSQGGVQSGLGFGIQWDNRNNNFYPDDGFWLLASATCFTPNLGSQYSYGRFQVDAREFVSIVPKHILAFQEYLQSNSNSPPFQSMAYLGGNQLLRGIYQGRYLDKNVAVLQMEYRFPIYDRFTGVTFGGVGEVSDLLADLDGSHTQTTVGLGLRYMVAVKQRVNVRVDFGIGPNESGFYVAVGEAL